MCQTLTLGKNVTPCVDFPEERKRLQYARSTETSLLFAHLMSFEKLEVSEVEVSASKRILVFAQPLPSPPLPPTPPFSCRGGQGAARLQHTLAHEGEERYRVQMTQIHESI